MPRAPTASAALVVALCAKTATRSLALSISSNGTRSACYSTYDCSSFGWTDDTLNDGSWAVGLTGITGVCGGNPLCRGHGTQCSAAEYCRDIGARLCTMDELMNCETQGRGCGYDYSEVWSSTPCSDYADGYYTVQMTHACISPGPQLSCYSAASTTPVTGRCCADVTPSTPSCESSVCVYPSPATPSPTPSPTLPQTGGAGASAVGDPHLTNVHGERFDLMQRGKHVLIRIPRKGGEAALLRVDAVAERLGGQCADIYFQEVNVTGKWADQRQSGGVRYLAEGLGGKRPKRAHWIQLGPVQLKVAHGHTLEGATYLNLYVKNLGHAGHGIGGLLGEDDHTDAEKRPEACLRNLMAL